MAMRMPMLALGLMSGTSCDGVDAALLTTDGLAHVAAGPALSHPYPEDFRQRLRSVLGGKGPVEAVAEELTRRHAAAVAALLEPGGLKSSECRGARLPWPDGAA